MTCHLNPDVASWSTLELVAASLNHPLPKFWLETVQVILDLKLGNLEIESVEIGRGQMVSFLDLPDPRDARASACSDMGVSVRTAVCEALAAEPAGAGGALDGGAAFELGESHLAPGATQRQEVFNDVLLFAVHVRVGVALRLLAC